MNKILRKTAAAVMALTIVGGTLPQYSGGFDIAKPAISAHAFDTSSFDTTWYDISTKTLHLKGDIENLYLSDNERYDGIILPEGVEKSDVEIIVAEKGTVFPENCEILFSGFTNLKKVDLSQADTSNVRNTNHMFSFCIKLTDLDISGFDTSNVTDMHCMFRNCSSLTHVDLSSFDTSKTKEMYLMFWGCSSLEELDLSSFDTSKVTYMSGMFKECGSLEKIDLSSFDTSKVIDMDEMFEKCSSLEELDLSSFDTSYVKYMKSMFSNCYSLRELDISNFDTSRVESMYLMFGNCRSLEELDLSNFDTSNISDMSLMFEDCTNLQKLDLSSFDTSEVEAMYRMFSGCNNLKTIYVSDKFVTDAVTNSADMLRNCKKLVGGNGTKFDSNKTGLEYARIDKPGQAGYFTDARVLDEKAVSRAKGASITLDGKIGVNLYVTLSDDVDHAILSGPNGDITLDAYDLSKLKYSSDDFTGYKLSYYVDSTQSDKKITLKFFDADNNQLDIANADNTFDADNTIEYTVNTYIKNYKYGNNDEKLDDLVYSLSNYCKAADNFFSGKTNNITGISNVTASSFNNYKIVKTEGLNAKMSLVLNSEVSIRINYAGEETEAILIDGDKETTLTKENGYFIISNISADKLANTYTLKIDSNEIKFSALSYGYAVMNGGSNDAKLQTLVKALYKYAETAKAYKA